MFLLSTKLSALIYFLYSIPRPNDFPFPRKTDGTRGKASLKRNLQLYARAGFSGCGNNNSRMLERINCS